MFSGLLFSAVLVLIVLNVLLLLKLRSTAQTERDSESRLRDELLRNRQQQSEEGRALREEIAGGLQRFASLSEQRSEGLRSAVDQRLAGLQAENERRTEQLRAGLDERLRTRFDEIGGALHRFATQSEQRADALRTAVDQRLLALQASNEQKLEQMRQTVDEKLQSTLETRLGESFRLVSERLEQVHKGLGEMQSLASGVGDLKRVLTNVTTRGAWGEVQLENLLTQLLAPDQFARNVSPTGSGERVEFAIRLPGPNGGAPVWLPVDAKFPAEAYQRLATAAERCDVEAVELYSRELETVIRTCAKTFSGKYLAPPHTTDFGILFLATEGLYAEALRRPGLAESVQRDYRVVLAGPTTFAALLNSLQMGFQTLSIQQRSGEVWKLLGDVKTQFGKYSQVLDLIRKRLDQATQTVDEASVRTRAIEKRLKNVDTDESEEGVLFQLPNAG
jgi:DNA recombination protein RmuC